MLLNYTLQNGEAINDGDNVANWEISSLCLVQTLYSNSEMFLN